MRKKSSWAWLAAFLTLAAVACSSASPGSGKAGSDPGGNGALNPAGSTATPSATATSAPAGLRTFPFPANVRVEFQTPLPASGPRRAAVIGYENYVDSMWYSSYTYGADTTYKAYATGNALTYTQGVIKDVSDGHQKLNGKITYYDISVPMSFASAAEVQACVDTSGLYFMDPKTGKNYETAFSSSSLHFQEQVSLAIKPNKAYVIRIADNSPSAGSSSGACI